MPRPPRFPAHHDRERQSQSSGIGRAALIACVITAGAVGALVLVAGRRAPVPVLTADAPRCPSAEPSVVGPAVLAYITSQRQPTPQRFLYAAGTDSALPDPGVVALQEKGPTYMYPAAEAQRAVVRARLATVGPWASLLVSYRGLRLADSTHAVVRLGGRFVGGAADGVVTPGRAISFTCESGAWRLTTTAEERST
ncbi:MAG TPA: hypothetical protein VFJ74_10220 [Gemmatimonadaceae bacterium]|nr:hypothetical protein [Gemmatimonadaceae bacterium]